MSLSSDPNAAHVHENLTGASTSTPTPTPKRRRLNLACNYCRSRKTRCDEQKPSCHACLAAGLTCITTDPRRPNRHVERREAGKSSDTALSLVPSQTPEYGILQQQTANAASRESAPSTALNGTGSAQILARAEEERPRPNGDDNNNNNDNDRNNANGERFRGLLPILKHEISSTSVDVLTGWLNVASFRLGLGHRFTSRSPQVADQCDAPFPIEAPSLSNSLQHRTWASNYFQSVHPVYPVVDKEEIHTTLDTLRTHGIRTLVTNPECLPQVVATLVVLDLGSSVRSSGGSDTCKVYMFLKDLLGRLIGRPTFPTIKALFLLALDMYHHDDLTSAWSTLTLCISMATAVGLGMSKPLFTANSNYDKRDGRRTWLSIFVFEKLIAFEMGRKSSISFDGTPHLERMMFSSRGSPQENSASVRVDNSQVSAQEQLEGISFFEAVISLAKLLGEIGGRCIGIRDREEVSEKEEMQRLITEKVKITGEACLQLTKWAENLPDNLRPGSDLIYDRCTFPYAAFLSIHYHNALLVLTRNSLLISESALRVTTEVIAKDQPWGHVIRNGQPMVASAARKLIKLFIEAEESETALLIPYTNAALHALYVLAVHLVRHPDNMLRKTDLDLIGNAAQFATTRIHAETNTIQGLSSILGDLDKVIEQSAKSDSTSHRIRNLIPSEPNQTGAREGDALDESHLSVSSDVSMYTLPNMTGLSDEELLTRLPQLDDFSNDTLHYYGMDIETWIGLDSIRWDLA